MVIYKFGGASVSSAYSINNLASIVSRCSDDLIIVISAFGKTTNALELILSQWLEGKDERFDGLRTLREYHDDIINELFPEGTQGIPDYEKLMEELQVKLSEVPSGNYDFEYDQLVSFGELLSTKIVSSYLQTRNIDNQWLDARNWLVTDDNFREAKVDFKQSRSGLIAFLNIPGHKCFVTQGFIGGTAENQTTTLGREGSDYTAAIIASLVDGERVVAWKDVPGIMTADPLFFPDAEILDEISYQEAIELSFYGAKVIHPKTIKPLQNKGIPLYVKSFLDPLAPGTLIHGDDKKMNIKPVIIIKKQQILVSLTPRDFSFVIEDYMSRIFSLFFKYRMKVNLLQHSAISFSVCIDNSGPYVQNLLEELGTDFKVLYNEDLELITIRHYTQEVIDRHTSGRTLIIEQRSRHTVMYVIR